MLKVLEARYSLVEKSSALNLPFYEHGQHLEEIQQLQKMVQGLFNHPGAFQGRSEKAAGTINGVENQKYGAANLPHNLRVVHDEARKMSSQPPSQVYTLRFLFRAVLYCHVLYF